MCKNFDFTTWTHWLLKTVYQVLQNGFSNCQSFGHPTIWITGSVQNDSFLGGSTKIPQDFSHKYRKLSIWFNRDRSKKEAIFISCCLQPNKRVGGVCVGPWEWENSWIHLANQGQPESDPCHLTFAERKSSTWLLYIHREKFDQAYADASDSNLCRMGA